ncbi:MAG TPA: enoyl-CoA hydratase/isomerase family protein [Nevskiaceae bacterium]|nr:enoyl-CoA hydratase/isomerase family protein [Nevskiaceae bacterium]
MAARETALTSAAQLQAWSADPATPACCSPLGPRPWLLVDATDAFAAQDLPRVTSWLTALAVPSIAVGGTGVAFGAGWAAACDVAVADLAAADAVVAGIERAPLAAAVLVQTLRVAEGLPLAAALHLESLAYSTLQAGPEFTRWLAGYRGLSRRSPSPASGPAVELARDGVTLRLRLNRAASHNAMTLEMRDALCEAFELVLADEAIESVTLDAAGKCFSTGGDLAEFGTAPDPVTAHLVRRLALPGRLLAACAARCEVRVHGACIGSGIEFPAFARHIVARRDAWFQLPELRYGLLPGAGGTVSISRRIGRQRATWMMLTGRRIDACTALAWGLVDVIEGQPPLP